MASRQQPRMSIEEFTNMQKAMKPAKASKYHAQPTTIDGIRFMSKSEAARYCELKMLERGGEIAGLELQPIYRIPGKSKKCVLKYVADFYYYDKASGKYKIEDVKGMLTPVYKIKKKIIEDYFDVTIVEIKMGAKDTRDAFALYGVKI